MGPARGRNHLLPRNQLLPGNATGRRDQAGQHADFNKDPTQRPLGGRWGDDYSRDRRGGAGGMSPYDNPLGGRLKYSNDDDEDDQVQMVTKQPDYLRHQAPTHALHFTQWLSARHAPCSRSTQLLQLICNCNMVQDGGRSDVDTRVQSRNIRWAAAAMAAMLLISGTVYE